MPQPSKNVLLREHPLRHRMGFQLENLACCVVQAQFVFVASDQGTLPEIAERPILEQSRLMVPSQEEALNSLPPSDWERDYFVNSVHSEDEDLLSKDLFVYVENLEINSGTRVKGRLRTHISFWESIGANRWVLQIICEGYCLPFVDMPKQVSLPNHKSAFREASFVSNEIDKLLKSGALVEVKARDLQVCNPLGVVCNNSRKPRLILDLRYVNKHLRSCKFQYEDIRTAANLFKQGDWFFKFDYVSGYHHIEIFPEHTTFLGCSWVVGGVQKFFKFTVLPFGLSTGPYVFSRIQ